MILGLHCVVALDVVRHVAGYDGLVLHQFHFLVQRSSKTPLEEASFGCLGRASSIVVRVIDGLDIPIFFVLALEGGGLDVA